MARRRPDPVTLDLTEFRPAREAADGSGTPAFSVQETLAGLVGFLLTIAAVMVVL